jgi:hypothetical protein
MNLTHFSPFCTKFVRGKNLAWIPEANLCRALQAHGSTRATTQWKCTKTLKRGPMSQEANKPDSLSHSEVARIEAFMSRTTDRY